MEKVVLIGFDGLDHKLLSRLIREDHLQAFGHLQQSGVLAPLRSTIPPLTPQAWTSMVTGVNPGKHGVFDFGEIPTTGYSPQLIHSEARRARGFWEYLQKQGYSCGVLNLPLSWPAEDMRLGWMTGGMHTPSLDELSPNPGVMQIARQVPGLQIDVMSYWYKDMQGFVQAVESMENARFELLMRLRKEMPVDVLMAVFVGVDRVCHALWGMQDFVIGDRGWALQDAVRRIYAQMDFYLKQILDSVNSSTLVMVTSDHGFGSLEQDIYLNNWLHRTGWLHFSPSALEGELKRHPNWRHGVAGSLALKVASRFPWFQRSYPALQKSFEAVDWPRTKAFSAGLFGNVYLNRVDRFPQGCLHRDAQDFEHIRRSLMDDLMVLRDESGPIVDQIHLGEEIYSGPFASMAPDLILTMRDYACITRGGFEFRSNLIHDLPAVHHSGNHRMDGVLMMGGQNVIDSARFQQQAELIDILPTLLAYLEVPIPDDIDGRVLHEAFEQAPQWKNSSESIYRQPFRTDGVSVSVEAQQRLKTMGYID